MKIKFQKLSVDAGNISVIDKALITRSEPFGCHEIPLENPGVYKVSLFLPRTWRGPRLVEKVLNVTSSTLMIGDACYMFSGEWMDLIGAPGFLFCGTGGDGGFDAEVIIETVALRKRRDR